MPPALSFRQYSDPLRVENRLDAAAVPFESALDTGRIGPLENPVLPCAETAEDFRFHRLRSGEPEVCFHAGQRIGRKARSLLEKDAHLVCPIDSVECRGDEPEPLAFVRIQRL